MKQLSRTVRSSFAGLVAAAVVGVAPGAFAQEKERPSVEERAEKRQARMERMVRERMAPKLGLDQAQEERLLGALQEVALERKAAMRAVKAEREALAALVERGASDAELSAQLERLEAASDKVPKRGALLDKTATFLTAEQQAKLALAAPDGKHGKHGMKGMKGKKGKRGFGPRGDR